MTKYRKGECFVGERGAKARVFAIENVRFVSTNYEVQITKYRKGECFVEERGSKAKVE